MKRTSENLVRGQFVNALREVLENRGEDVGMIASNTLNFPYVYEGEECWVEVVVKVPHGTKDEEYDGYGRRESYQLDLDEKAAKAAEREKAAAEKKAKAEAKKKEKEAKAE